MELSTPPSTASIVACRTSCFRTSASFTNKLFVDSQASKVHLQACSSTHIYMMRFTSVLICLLGTDEEPGKFTVPCGEEIQSVATLNINIGPFLALLQAHRTSNGPIQIEYALLRLLANSIRCPSRRCAQPAEHCHLMSVSLQFPVCTQQHPVSALWPSNALHGWVNFSIMERPWTSGWLQRPEGGGWCCAL
jgi:hypothetical protein